MTRDLSVSIEEVDEIGVEVMVKKTDEANSWSLFIVIVVTFLSATATVIIASFILNYMSL